MNDKVYDEIRTFYGQRGFAGRVGFGEKPAVIVLDFILGFTDAASPLGGKLDEALSETVRILEMARASGVPVLFTTVEYDSTLKDAGLFPKKVAGLKWLVAGSRWVELDPRLGQRPGELLIKKKYASAFFGTGLATLLATQGVDTLVITGCTTSGCVRATAVDALQHGLHTIVPREAVGDRAELPHEANLFDIDAKYGDVVSVEETRSYLAHIGSGQPSKSVATPQNQPPKTKSA
jgi:maleamate amidohydrolase